MSENFTNGLIINTIYHLLNFEKFSSFQAAAKEAAIQNNFQMVLFSEDFNVVFSVETRHNVSIEDTVRYGLDQNFDKEAKATKIDFNGVTTYWGPVSVAGNKFYLMLVDNEKNFSKDDTVKLAEIIELAMGMWNYTPKRDIVAEFFRAVRRGNTTLARSLLEEMGYKESDIISCFYMPGGREKDALSKLSIFERKYGLRAIKAYDGDDLIGANIRSDRVVAWGINDWKEFIREEFSNSQFNFSVLGIEGIDDLYSGFSLISKTEPFTKLVYPRKKTFTKYEMILVNTCVSICMQGNSIKKSYLDLIKPLRSGSDSKSRQLLETLEVFILDAGLSAPKAASIMGIHANTIQYRIKRIKDILGVDITSYSIVPGLRLALSVGRIEKEVRSF